MKQKSTPNSKLLAAERQEYAKVQRNFRIAAVFALTVLLFGAMFYHHFESLNWIDAFYFCVITLATVGYGDIVPHTNEGKIFTMFYVLVGIGIIATFANLLLKNAFFRRQLRQKESRLDISGPRDGIDLG